MHDLVASLLQVVGACLVIAAATALAGLWAAVLAVGVVLIVAGLAW